VYLFLLVKMSHCLLCLRPPKSKGHYKMRRGVCPSVRPSVACLDLTRERNCLWIPKIGRMEAHHTSNSWTYLEVKRSKVKVTRLINTVTKSVLFLPNGKAYEVQTWYTYRERRPVSPTSALTSKVKDQGRKVTWWVWQAHKSRIWNVTETPKLAGKLPTPRAIMHTSFKGKGHGSRSPGRLMWDRKCIISSEREGHTNFKLPRWSTNHCITDKRHDLQGQTSWSPGKLVPELQTNVINVKPFNKCHRGRVSGRHTLFTTQLVLFTILSVVLFSQTWLRCVWLMEWQIRLSVCRLWRACTLLKGFNFSGIFLHHIVTWPSGNSPTKNHEDRPRARITPFERVKQERGGQTGESGISPPISRYLFIIQLENK